MMKFFEACADWAQARDVVCVFERDEYDGWYARVPMRDANGPFSAVVNLVSPRGAYKHTNKDGSVTEKPAETHEEYAERIGKMCGKACADARQHRINHGNASFGKAA